MNTVGPNATKTTFRSQPLVFGLQLARDLVGLLSDVDEVTVTAFESQSLHIEVYHTDTEKAPFTLTIVESDDHQLQATVNDTNESYKSPFDYGLQAFAAGVVRELLAEKSTTEG